MIQVWKWIKNNPNRAMFLLPILLVAGISISHVVSWYDMANPINWAIYLSIAIEVAAITALVAATNKIKGGIWFMFGIVTFIQMLGNIFYCYKEIDANGDLFKSWVELTGPVWELMGTELTDTIGMKRWLAFLEGGLLLIISLTSLHFFVKYEDPSKDNPVNEDSNDENSSDNNTQDIVDMGNENYAFDEDINAILDNLPVDDIDPSENINYESIEEVGDEEYEEPNENLKKEAERYKDNQEEESEEDKYKKGELKIGKFPGKDSPDPTKLR